MARNHPPSGMRHLKLALMGLFLANWQAMSDSPLIVLGLSPDTGVTAKDIKAAYARLLKNHRPDQDPEGFKRLRTAYEQAMAAHETGPTASSAAAQAGAGSMATPVPASGETPDRTEPELTPGAQMAFTALRASIESKARQKVREAWAKLDQEAGYLGLRDRFHLAMRAFNKAPINLLSDVCTDERLLAHLQEGDVQLAHAALKGWSDQREVRRIREFISSLNRARSLHGLPEWALVMVWTAMAMAPWEPETANNLAQRAYPTLPPQARTDLIQKADHEVFLGRLIASLPDPEKVFWLASLRGNPPSASWGDTEGRKMLRNLLTLCGPKWAGFNVLSSVLPEEQWKRLVLALNSLL